MCESSMAEMRYFSIICTKYLILCKTVKYLARIILELKVLASFTVQIVTKNQALYVLEYPLVSVYRSIWAEQTRIKER